MKLSPLNRDHCKSGSIFQPSVFKRYQDSFQGVDTVDGSEIRGSPVEVGSFFPLFARVLYIPGTAGFLPSTV